MKIDCQGAEFGFAGTATAGREWNATTLKQYLGQHYSTITTDHRLETESAILETFHATKSQEPTA